jgi:hypothetical protein
VVGERKKELFAETLGNVRQRIFIEVGRVLCGDSTAGHRAVTSIEAAEVVKLKWMVGKVLHHCELE